MSWDSLILVIVIILFIAAVAKGYKKKLSKGCCGAGDSENIKKIKVSDKNKANYPYKATMVVDGMICSNCTNRVENALNSIEGVWAATEDDAKTINVYMKQNLDIEILRKAVSDLGDYTVLSITTD